LDEVFSKHDIEAVIHFVASSLVGESVSKPLDYYENNLIASHILVFAMLAHDVKKIVFSSTAATTGSPNRSLSRKRMKRIRQALMEKRSWLWKECSAGVTRHMD
jgi:UDP-glucose 4-epimerase